MTNFDKYKHLCYGNFDASYTNFPSDLNALNYNVAREQKNKFETEVYNLIEFIRLWKDNYKLFCDRFNTYTLSSEDRPLWSIKHQELSLPTYEFYIDGLFAKILNKRATFKIQEYKNNYTWKNDREFTYTRALDQNILISGDNFTIIGKDSSYRLDIKMNTALICSLICTISNNYIIYDWYSKQSRFKEFIDKMSSCRYFVEFQIDNRYSRILISGGQNEPSLRIDIDGKWLYFILPNEILCVESRLQYNHLDNLFGKDRKEPLTEEDLQLYSIVNEGRKPLMYDFEH